MRHVIKVDVISVGLIDLVRFLTNHYYTCSYTYIYLPT